MRNQNIYFTETKKSMKYKRYQSIKYIAFLSIFICTMPANSQQYQLQKNKEFKHFKLLHSLPLEYKNHIKHSISIAFDYNKYIYKNIIAGLTVGFHQYPGIRAFQYLHQNDTILPKAKIGAQLGLRFSYELFNLQKQSSDVFLIAGYQNIFSQQKLRDDHINNNLTNLIFEGGYTHFLKMNKDGSIGMTLSLKYIPFEMGKKYLKIFLTGILLMDCVIKHH